MGWLQANEGSRVLLVSLCMWRQRERHKGDRLGLSRKNGMLQLERWHKYEDGVSNGEARKFCPSQDVES